MARLSPERSGQDAMAHHERAPLWYEPDALATHSAGPEGGQLMDALVLSGGSIKGAWQAGAIDRVYESGYRPQIITGTSVGALNAAHLAAYPGPDAGTLLAHFWETKVTGPKVAARKRPWYELAYRVIFNKWDGVVDTSPLTHLVHDVLGSKLPRPVGDVNVQVASVNLHSGQLVYTRQDQPEFIDAVLASTAEPVLMPLRHVKGEPHYDGGLRDITPLKRAIELGATRIIAVICQPAGVDEYAVREGHITSLGERTLDIITNEIMLNDIDTLLAVNEALIDAPDSRPGKRVIPLTVIQPTRAIGVSLESFTSADIVAMLKQGRADAERALHTSAPYGTVTLTEIGKREMAEGKVQRAEWFGTAA